MFKEKFCNKRVLFVPVYSARSYETGLYDLNHDGNFSRLMSLCANVKMERAFVLIPDHLKAFPTAKEEYVQFYCSQLYGANANETRHRDQFEAMYTTLIADLFRGLKVDYLVCEPNFITLRLARLEEFKDKLIYWCVASATSCGTPWFVEEYKYVDKEIARYVETACANKAQVEYLEERAYLEEEFYDPSVFDYKTIFFPFRLTDPNYHATEFKNVIDELSKRKDLTPFKVLYTDMNDSHAFDGCKNVKQISSDHDVYINVLKGRPIIPYLENDDVLEHISIREFLYYNCEVIMFTQKHKRMSDNIIYIKDISCLYETLVNKLRRR